MTVPYILTHFESTVNLETDNSMSFFHINIYNL